MDWNIYMSVVKDELEFSIGKEKKPNANILRRIWHMSGYTIERLSKLTGVKLNTFYNWTARRREPSSLEIWAIQRIIAEKSGAVTNSAVIRTMDDRELIDFIKNNINIDWENFLKNNSLCEDTTISSVTNLDLLRVVDDESFVKIINLAKRHEDIESWLKHPANIDERIYTKMKSSE